MNLGYKPERVNPKDEEWEKRLEKIMEKKIHSAIREKELFKAW